MRINSGIPAVNIGRPFRQVPPPTNQVKRDRSLTPQTPALSFQGVAKGYRPFLGTASLTAPRFGAAAEFNLERFLDKEGDDWLCAAMDTARDASQGEFITPHDVFLALLEDFQKDLAGHQASTNKLKRHADSYLGIKLGMSKNPAFEQDQQATLQWLDGVTRRMKAEAAQSALSEAERKKLPGHTLQEALKDLYAVFQEIKDNAPPNVQRQVPLADLDLLLQLLVRLSPDSLRQDLSRFQTLSGISLEPPLEAHLPEKLKEKYATLAKAMPTESSLSSSQPLDKTQRNTLLAQYLPNAQADALAGLSARLRGVTPKALQWLVQQAKQHAEGRKAANNTLTPEDFTAALGHYTPAVAHELGCALLSPEQAEWNAFQSVTRSLCQAVLKQEAQESNILLPDSETVSDLSCLSAPSALSDAAGSEATKTTLFNRIVLAEASKAIQQLVYQDTRIPNPQDARLASRTALLMSAQHMMLKNRIYVEGDPARWMIAALPPQVSRDVEAVLSTAQTVAQSILNDYQPFVTEAVVGLIGPTGEDGAETLNAAGFEEALRAYDEAHYGEKNDCLRKIRELKSELFQQTEVETSGRTFARPLRARQEEN